eukprot:9464763-Lingulodinium_polyedra.AAC.1
MRLLLKFLLLLSLASWVSSRLLTTLPPLARKSLACLKTTNARRMSAFSGLKRCSITSGRGWTRSKLAP